MRGKQSARYQRVARPGQSNTSAASARRSYDKHSLVRDGSADSRPAYPVGVRTTCKNPRQTLEETVHRDKLKPLGSLWGRLGGGDGLPLHSLRAQSRLKPGDPTRSQEPFQFYVLAVTEPHELAGPSRLGLWEKVSPGVLMPEPRVSFAGCTRD